MAQITAVILAAGLGRRMGPRGELMPKGLIKMGGMALVPQSVATLRRAGFARIALVTGHLPDHYQAVFGDSEVDLIHNPDFATTGSLRTLDVALSAIDGALVILESDLIYAPEVLDAVDPNVSRFLVSGPTGAGDEVYSWVDPAAEGNRLTLVSKDRSASELPPFGEMIGVTVLTAQDARKMQDVAQRVLQEAPASHYEDGLVALAKETVIETVRFEDVAWAEVDDEEMLARAKAQVWPKVAAARQKAWGADLP